MTIERTSVDENEPIIQTNARSSQVSATTAVIDLRTASGALALRQGMFRGERPDSARVTEEHLPRRKIVVFWQGRSSLYSRPLPDPDAGSHVSSLVKLINEAGADPVGAIAEGQHRK